MLKFSNTARKAALAALLGAGLAGSAAVTLTPVAAHAQYYYRDWDDRPYYRDWDDRYHGWVGIGVPGFGIGFYTSPYRYYYGPYCSRYDFYHGYC